MELWEICYGTALAEHRITGRCYEGCPLVWGDKGIEGPMIAIGDPADEAVWRLMGRPATVSSWRPVRKIRDL